MIVVVNKKRFKIVLTFFIILFAIMLAFLLYKPFMRLQYPYKYRDCVARNAAKYEVDPLLVLAVMKSESNFKEDALSSKDAKGLMQLMDQTALWCAEQLKMENFDIQQIHNPETNIELGTYYLSLKLSDFNGNMTMALSAYNAGSAKVQKWLSEDNKETLAIEDIPYGETKKYVSRTLSNYNAYSKLWGK